MESMRASLDSDLKALGGSYKQSLNTKKLARQVTLSCSRDQKHQTRLIPTTSPRRCVRIR